MPPGSAPALGLEEQCFLPRRFSTSAQRGRHRVSGGPTVRKARNPAFLLVVAKQEFNLGFSLQRRWLLQTSTRPEADGLHTGLTNWTLSAKVFQKQGLAQGPYQWVLFHSLLCKTRGLIRWLLKSSSAWGPYSPAGSAVRSGSKVHPSKPASCPRFTPPCNSEVNGGNEQASVICFL